MSFRHLRLTPVEKFSRIRKILPLFRFLYLPVCLALESLRTSEQSFFLLIYFPLQWPKYEVMKWKFIKLSFADIQVLLSVFFLYLHKLVHFNTQTKFYPDANSFSLNTIFLVVIYYAECSLSYQKLPEASVVSFNRQRVKLFFHLGREN